MTQRSLLAWVGVRYPVHVPIVIPYRTTFLDEHEIRDEHRAFAMPGWRTIVAVWNTRTSAWEGFTHALIFTRRGMPISDGTPDNP